MSVIYSFLQKRKLHENQHGYILVFVAYILSAFMLLLGSDLFYNISSSAADAHAETKEETPSSINFGLHSFNSDIDTVKLTRKGIINPYGLEDSDPEAAAPEKLIPENTAQNSSDSISTSGDTVWLLGSAMDGKTFDSLMQKIGSLKPAKHKDRSSVKKITVKKALGTKYGKITGSEVKLLERIVQAEAGGEDMKGKILIVNVIMNRIENKHFPDTVKSVIFQRKNGGYQFSPVANGRFWSVNISAETKKAVQRALKGEDYSKGALYFVARKKADSSSMRWFDKKLNWLFKHGGHEFYKNK